MTSFKTNILVLLIVAVCFYIVNGIPPFESAISSNVTTYPFQYVSREDWGGEPSLVKKPLKKPVPFVVIHHTYEPAACNSTAVCSRAMRSMQSYHNSKGWGDIGYNFCVGTLGDVYEGRGWDTVGVHAGRANNHSIGICLIGDWRTASPPTTMLESAKKLISAGVEDGHISTNYKLAGHKQIMSTECPGEALFNMITSWDHFTKEVPELYTVRT